MKNLKIETSSNKEDETDSQQEDTKNGEGTWEDLADQPEQVTDQKYINDKFVE